MSTNEFNEDDLDAYAENIAKRTADRESRLQRLAMLKRQQLENDEEEFHKSTKKQASSTTNVISTSCSPVKSPRKLSQQQSTGYNYTSPSKNHQFLPSFNSPQRSFVLTKSIERSPQKISKNDSMNTTPSEVKITSLMSSPDKTAALNTTPLQSASKSTIYICSPKPYQKSPACTNQAISPIKSPIKPFMCHSPSQASIASNFSNKVVSISSDSTSTRKSSVDNTNDIMSMNSTSESWANQPSPSKTINSAIDTTSNHKMVATKMFKSSNNIELAREMVFKEKEIATQVKSASALAPVELSRIKEQSSTNSVMQFSPSIQSSSSNRPISPIKQNGLNTPEKLCVSDKKKLFENAIKEETELAKRVQGQKMFLMRKKMTDSYQPEHHEQPSMPKKIKTSILEFESKMANSNRSSPSWSMQRSPKNEVQLKKIGFNQETPSNRAPKILDVEMKQKVNQDFTVRPDDEISKFIDQAEISCSVLEQTNKLLQFENTMHSILEESNDDQEIRSEKQKHVEDEQVESEINFIRSSTKTSLYPSLVDLDSKVDEKKEDCEQERIENDLVHNHPNVKQIVENEASMSPKSPLIKETIKETIEEATITPKSVVSTKQQEIKTSKSITPMRTLSQYRREQKQRAANNATPSNNLDVEKARMKEEMERARWTVHQAEMKATLEKLKVLVEKHEKAIEQSSNAIALCLKNPEQRGSSSQLAAEQILLISSQRRVACKQRIEQIESQMRSSICRAPIEPLATGCVTIDRIQIPLKSDFIVGQFSNQDPLNHHFICLARCGEVVAETELLDSANSIQQSSITFDLHKPRFEELDKDFEIHLELYGLALAKEKMHDKRSLIMNSIKIPPLSPKLGGRSKKMNTQSVNYSANQGFTRIGLIKFDRNNILNKKYILEDFMTNSPVSGQIEVDFRMQSVYNSDYKLEDFLNVYDGRYWKSRYYVLKGYLLAYWQYKEDYVDKSLPSLGTIDLRKCLNRKVSQVSLNVCSRSHSFVLVTEETIVDKKVNYNDNKVYKTTEQKCHTFAADSKEDFDTWCNHLNRLLPLIRIWEEGAQAPQDLKFLEQ